MVRSEVLVGCYRDGADPAVGCGVADFVSIKPADLRARATVPCVVCLQRRGGLALIIKLTARGILGFFGRGESLAQGKHPVFIVQIPLYTKSLMLSINGIDPKRSRRLLALFGEEGNGKS